LPETPRREGPNHPLVSPRPLAQHVAEENHSFGFKDSQKMPQKRLKRTEEIQSKLQK